MKNIKCPEMLVSSPPHHSSKLWVVYLTSLPECSTGISHLARPKWTSWSSPTNFYLFQFSHMCKWLHHPTRCLARNLGVFLDTSLFLILTANSSPYPIDSTPFFWNLGTSLAQVLSPSPEPLQELTISFSASSPSLLPLLPPPSLPTPAPPLQSPFSSRQPEQSFEFDRVILLLKTPQKHFCLPGTWGKTQEHRNGEKAPQCWDLGYVTYQGLLLWDTHAELIYPKTLPSPW